MIGAGILAVFQALAEREEYRIERERWDYRH
jgi:hypothetical protein